MSFLKWVDAQTVSEAELKDALSPSDKFFLSVRRPTHGDSAGNATQTITPPNGFMYRVLWVQMNAINSADVGDRYPVVRTVIVPANPHLICECPATFAASVSWRTTFTANGGALIGTKNAMVPLPELYVNYNESLEMLVVGGKAADVYTARAFVEVLPSKQQWSSTS